MRITVAAPAKINLWLRIGDVEPSGFHAIDTLFCSLQVADSVIVRPGSGRPTLEVTHARPLTATPELGPEERNLAVRAARGFMARAGLESGPGIQLVKRIPVGGGLGGGSSDAAAVLRAMSRLNPGAVTPEALMEMGARLGSDVPFFVRGAPLARGTGRGDRIEPVSPLPARPVVVAIPRFPVATTAAYGWLDDDRRDGVETVEPDGTTELDWSMVARQAENDFEGPVFGRHPQLRDVRDRLREDGAFIALLAGSGSTVFGVFDTRDAARDAAGALRESDPELRVLLTRTRTR